MNRCRTCKYWTPPGAVVDEEMPDHGHCGRIFHFTQVDDDWALVEDSEGYGGTLRTRDAFGCVLWEENS